MATTKWWQDGSELQRLEQIARRKAQQPGGGIGEFSWKQVVGPWPEAPSPAAAQPQQPQQPLQMSLAQPIQQQVQQPIQMTPYPQSPPLNRLPYTDVGKAQMATPTTPTVQIQATPGALPVFRDTAHNLFEAWFEPNPVEEAQLGATLAAIPAQNRQAEEAARSRYAQSYIQQGQPQYLQGLTPEQQQAALRGAMPQASPVPSQQGWTGALLHDWQQLPGIRQAKHVTGAALRTVGETLSMPTLAVEQGTFYAEIPAARAQYEALQDNPELKIYPRYDISELWGTLAAYGYTKDQIKAGLKEAARVAYSGTEHITNMARRVIEGENPRVVAFGRTVNVSDPTPEDREHYNAYMRAVWHMAQPGNRDAAAAAAMQQIQETGSIPGESHIFRELAGQLILDPLNLIDPFTKQARMARTMRKAEQALGASDETEDLARMANEIADRSIPELPVTPLAQSDKVWDVGLQQFIPKPPDWKPGQMTNILPDAIAEFTPDMQTQQRMTAALLEGKTPAQWQQWIKRNAGKINPFGLTDEAATRVALSDAGVIYGTLLAQTDSAEEGVNVLRAMYRDPDSLVHYVGNMGDWTRSSQARSLLGEVVDELEKLPAYKAAQAGAQYNPAQLLVDLDDAIYNKIAQYDQAKGILAPYQRFQENAKGLMSEFYLRTPGYAIRNTASDLNTMFTDGIGTFDGWDTITGYLDRFGPTTRRVQDGIAGGLGQAQRAQIGESRLAKLLGGRDTIIGRTVNSLSKGMGEFISTGGVLGKRTVFGEETRYVRAFYKALRRAVNEAWQPELTDDLAAALGSRRAKALQWQIRNATTKAERLAAVERALDGTIDTLIDYSQYVDNADDLSIELIRVLDKDFRNATELDQYRAVIEKARRQISSDMGKAFLSDPLPPVTRVKAQAEMLQNAAEDAADIERAAKKAGMAEDAAQQAAAAHYQKMQQLEQGTAAMETAALDSARQAIDDGADTRQIASAFRKVRTDAGYIQMDATKAVDNARSELHKKLATISSSKADNAAKFAQSQAEWRYYYDLVGDIRGKEQAQVRGLLSTLQQQITSGTLPPLEQTSTREAIARTRAMYEELAQRRQRLGVMGQGEVANVAEDTRDFAVMLETNRLAVSEAQQDAWRIAISNPSRDSLDVMAQAERDVINRGIAAREKYEELYRQYQATWGTKKQWPKEQFRKMANEIWQRAFADQASRFDMTRRELLQLPISAQAQQTMLNTLGWPQDVLQEISEQDARIILVNRVAYDPTIGGPIVPLEELRNWTMASVAADIGIDITDPRKLTTVEWERIANEAEHKARMYQTLANNNVAWIPTNLQERHALLRNIQRAHEADPAMAQRLINGAEQYKQIAMQARARAQLGIANIGNILENIPQGARSVEYHRAGDLIEVIVRGDGRELAKTAFDNPGEAIREVNRIQAYINSGATLPDNYLPYNITQVATDFNVDPDSILDWRRLELNARANGDHYMTDALETVDPRRKALFDEAVEAARNTRGFDPDDEARYAKGMLPHGYNMQAGVEQRVYRSYTQEYEAAKMAGATEKQLQAIWDYWHDADGNLWSETTDNWYQAMADPERDTYKSELANQWRRNVLEQAGMSDFELEQMTGPQIKTLYDELANGDIIRNKNGQPRKIGSLTPERRQRLIKDAGPEMIELAARGQLQTDQAMANEWYLLASEAQKRAQVLAMKQQGVINADEMAYFLDPEHYDEMIMQFNLLVDSGMLPTELTQDLTEINMMASMYGDNADDVQEALTRLAAGGIPPDDPEIAELVAKAIDDPQALQDLQDKALIQGGMTVDEIPVVAENISKMPEPPTMAEMADVTAQQQLRMLDQLEQGLVNNWGAMQGEAGQLNIGQKKALIQWANNLEPQWRKARTIAVEAARQMADFALLDYEKRRNFDTMLSMVVPYSYWMTRSARNWAIRMSQRPQMLNHYMKYKQAMKDYNEQRGYRSRFEGAYEIPVDGMPSWMGESVFINPENILFPFAGLAPNDWENPADAKNGVDYIYRTLNKYGFRPYGYIDIGLEALGLIPGAEAPGEKEGLWSLADVPQINVLQGIRALSRGETGQPVNRLFTEGPALQEWDSYRIARNLRNISGHDPAQLPQVLIAMQLLNFVARGELQPQDALQQTPTAERLAQSLNWTLDELAVGQQTLAQGWLYAQQEKAIGQITSALAGTSMRIYPEGEQQQEMTQQQLRAQAYSPLTGQGSREEYEAYRDQHPETYAYSVSRAFIPSEVMTEDWTPQSARGALEYGGFKDQAEAEMETSQLEAIRQGGLWNWQGLQDARAAYVEATQAERERLQMGDYQGPEEFTPLYGSTPTETLDQARVEMLQAFSNARPRKVQFEDTEQYEAALAQYYDLIAQGRYEDAGVEFPPGIPQDIMAAANTLTEDVLESYWRENDTIAEALNTAFEEWYSKQWDAYRKSAGPEVTAGLPEAMKQSRYDRRAAAWEKYVENGPRMTLKNLTDEMRAIYGNRFTDAEIRQALQGITYPTLEQVWLDKKTPEEREEYYANQEMSVAKEEFWDLYWQLSDEAEWRATKGQPVVALVISRDTRGTATSEQYQMAAAILEQYFKDNPEHRIQAGMTATEKKESESGSTLKSNTKKTSSYRGGSGGGGGGSPATIETDQSIFSDWNLFRSQINYTLASQLSDYFLRGTPLDAAAMSSLTEMAERLGWKGTIEELLEMLRAAFAIRKGTPGGPSGRFTRRRY